MGSGRLAEPVARPANHRAVTVQRPMPLPFTHRLVHLNSLMDGLPPILNMERIRLGTRKLQRLKDPKAKQV